MALEKKTDKKDVEKKEKGKKAVTKVSKIPSKKGINLARKDEELNRQKKTLLYVIIAGVCLIALSKFGVYDQIDKLSDAKAAYETTHTQYEIINAQLADYDEVLLEYRTYSMDWLENDDTGRYVDVPRRTILDMIQEKIMPKGEVSGISIAGNTVNVQMSGMSLKQISAMCKEIEETDFVKSAILNNASTDGQAISDEELVSKSVGFSITITIQRVEEEE